jgi:uroporphyrinogen decarboxylase
MAAEIDGVTRRLAAVGETLRKARAALEPSRALIGFAGGPWTVATYMIEGHASDRLRARAMAYEQAEQLDVLIEILVEATARYLIFQAEAGAQAVQLFDTWSDNLPEPLFERLVSGPHERIVDRLRRAGITIPVIGFPRGAGGLLEGYLERSGVEGVGLDVSVPAAMGRRLQARATIQGALDPVLLRAGGEALDRRIDQLLGQWGGGPYVFNLGWGMLPDTPLDHVAQALGRISGWGG